MHISVTIVGCGAVIESLYRKPLQKLEKNRILTVVNLVDSCFNRARKMQAFFPQARAYENIDDALSQTSSNLTIVASPPALHAEHSVLALENSNHVLCEKPMAITREECTRMVQAACDARRSLAIGMTRRFFPSLCYLENMLTAGELGECLSFSYREGGQYCWPVTTPANFQRAQGGGGVLFDVGSHVLDLIIWLFGVPSNVSYFDDALKGGIEANCLIKMQGDNFYGLTQLSWDHNLANEFRIIGTKAEVILKLDVIDKVIIKKSGRYHTIEPKIAFPITTKIKNTRSGIPKIYSACFYYQIVQMIRAIHLGENVAVSGEEGREVISLIEKCYGMAKPIDMTWLPPAQNETLKRLHWNKRQ